MSAFDGLRVVELVHGVSDTGLGLAGAFPGMLLASLGAHVTRIVPPRAPEIDADLTWTRAWHRTKDVVATDDLDEIRELMTAADVAFVYGPPQLVEGRGLGADALTAVNPRLIHVRCAPSRTAQWTTGGYALLVEARAGFCSQLAGHRDGPTFVDARASAAGTGFLMAASALALLRRRTLTGTGGQAETSLYDGLLATLGCMIGRSERAAREVEQYWEKGSWFPNFLYRCGDGELIQVWFGGKGMYAKLLEVLGDEPSEKGYYADQSAGLLNARAERWRSTFATEPRDVWVERLRAVGVACEPVLGPGQALSDPHLAAIGLAVQDGADVVLDVPVTLTPLSDADSDRAPVIGRRLLEGVKVADFSAFVAGPLAAQVLADLGADVIKVEPLEGEAMRGAAYAVAACQRGKRSLALDITAPDARPIVDRLLGWADVVLHNFRVGVSERLGIDEATVARLNPGAVYCHASAFGPTGPRAKYPGNDALMQALTGFERAIGGEGNDPIAATWIPLDMAGGWVAACGILAGLAARAETGRGQQVASSLLGSALLLHSGVYAHDGELVTGPALDGAQTGYGPGHRIYAGADGEWFALVLPDAEAWDRLRAEVPDLPLSYAPLRSGASAEVAARAEQVLEAAFATAPAAEWMERLHAIHLLAEPLATPDRDGFRRGILDDPVNRELGRVAAYQTKDWGHFEQIGPLLRTGSADDRPAGPSLHLPGIGEHTTDTLTTLGFTADEIAAFLDAKVARQG
ncbi:MAG TPA: CoA transferase [Mycobacteriales bacterium]|nr:CoA transferase [Mycobacteriales bacterium]